MLGFAHGRLIDCDKVEVGYVRLAEVGPEFLFQVVAERGEKAAVIVTSNLPFSEWTQVIPNARLFKALLDCITDRAHIIETGAESHRFRRTLEKRESRTFGRTRHPHHRRRRVKKEIVIVWSFRPMRAKRCAQHVPCAISVTSPLHEIGI
jgi:hypothetical protein